MAERTCPGLPADWLNAWLAALGAVHLVPTLRLRWTDDPVALAVFEAPGDADPAELIERAWPTDDDIASLPIARRADGLPELTLNPDGPTWTDRSAHARRHRRSWTLTSLFTDLAWDRSKRQHVIAKGQFHTPMPGRDNTVHDRIRKLVALGDLDIARSLDGSASRVGNYGLGFDLTRIGSLADDASQMVDPVVEILAFFGLSFFPCRGELLSDGTYRRRQRPWSAGSGSTCRWFSWRPLLDAAAIDALLDSAAGRKGPLLGVTATWETVAFEQRGSSDVTRGFGASRV